MQLIRSYYRRSPGMASAAATGQTTSLRPVVYDGPSSTTPVRFRGRQQVTGLQFTTQLPGGFGSCSFAVTGAAARQWAIDTGHRVVIWDGKRVAWQGWIEDIERGSQAVRVQALGPWQTLGQRLIAAASYASYTATDAALKTELLAYGDYVSTDQTNIKSTGVDIGDLEKDYWPVSDLVSLVCDAGNSAGQPMLFALWEPELRIDGALSSTNIITNSDLESGSGILATDWEGGRVATNYHSASHSLYIAIPPSASSSVYHPSSTGYGTCEGNTAYQLRYWAYSSSTNTTWQAIITWYNSSNTLLSTSTGWVNSMTASTWTEYFENVTSPATAVKFRLQLKFTNNSAGSVGGHIDDVYLYKLSLSITKDIRAVPYLWPRDLTDYDYVMRRKADVNMVETTRELTNAVIASYGADLYTAFAQNTTSQGLYRRRDQLVSAGSEASADLAALLRDVRLAKYKDPAKELASGAWTFDGRSTILMDRRGLPVSLALVRAGERIRILDGEYAGTIVMIDKTSWSGGQLTVTPEKYADVAQILARSL